MNDDWFDRYSYTDEWKRDTKEERLKKLNDRNTFLVQEYNKIEQRLKDYQKLQAQLKDANETIKFYGDRSSWRYEEIEDCDACIIADDLSVPDGWCEENGGKRARKYLKKYKVVSE
jgi:predicted nuclease with TOPRIM domain